MAGEETKQSFIQSLKEIDFSELSADNMGAWPFALKTVIWIALFIVVCFAGYKLWIEEKTVTLDKASLAEVSLKSDFEKKAADAANLEAYRNQMEKMEEMFGALLSQLPGETEVPGLLEDISKYGEANGLALSEIMLKGEVQKDFYIELPIDITVKGTYHDMGAFVSQVSSLPRIVTLHDFSVNPDATSGELIMKVLAKTYRYKQDKEGGVK
jgi:type IV pilus assembly protein PilO